jgi:glycosyltransferase involved in cell wall biosynthesis
MPKVTIGIPTYNSERFIEQAINSVLNQTYKDFELIICDDLSNDNTDEIINIYLEKDKRIRYFKNSEHIGLFENFNQCIKHSSGEYLNILGHDDVMLSRNIEVKVEIFEQYPNVGLVASSIEAIDEKNNTVNLNWAKYNNSSLVFGRDWIINKVSANNPICCPFVFLRRSIIEKSGLFNSKYKFVGDFDMWLRVALYSDVYFIQEVLGLFRWHQNNESHKYNELYYLAEVSQIWDEFIEQLNFSLEDLEKIEDRIFKGLFEFFIVNNIYHDNLDYVLEMNQILITWR